MVGDRESPRVRGAWIARAFGAAGALALALAGWYPGNNPDTFGHLAQGRQIAELGHVPQLDTWSLLPGAPRPWHNYEWLSDLATWLLFDHYGYVTVTLCKCALLALAALCLSELALRIAGARAAMLTSLVVIASIPAIRARLSDRPHVLGVCLATSYLALLFAIERARTQRARVMLVGVLALAHLLWVNTHGSHLLGLGIVICFVALGAAEARRWYALALGACVITSCISPYGPAISLDAIDHIADPRYRELVSEWRPWQPEDPPWLQLGPALHGALLAVLAPRLLRFSPSTRAMLPLALVIGTACFRSIRFLAEFMLLTAPLAGVGLAIWSRRLSAKPFFALSLVLLAALAVGIPPAAAALPPGLGLGAGLSYQGSPRAGGELLAAHAPAPRVLASVQDSWFTMFAAPESRFVIDGRIPFYGPDWVTHVSRAFGDPARFRALIDQLDVNVVITSHASRMEQQLAIYVKDLPGWSLRMIEDLHATYVRDGTLDDRGAGSYPPFRALLPSYDLDWLLAADPVQQSRMREELDRLSKVHGASGYRAWVRGALTLSPLRRGGGSDGFRWPRTVDEWATYREGYSLITRAAKEVGDVPVVSALHAALAAVFCDFHSAQSSLEKALADGPSREPLLAQQELALRRGDVAQVRRVVEAARAQPEGKDDPWLAELHDGLSRQPTCPRP